MMSYLDTRDLATRLNELQEEMAELNNAITDAEEELADLDCTDKDLVGRVIDVTEERCIWLDDNQKELDELTVIESEVGEFSNGKTLIPEHLFTEYTEETARDCGCVGDNSDWVVIDWEATADNLKMDYSEVDYQGETYLFRMS